MTQPTRDGLAPHEWPAHDWPGMPDVSLSAECWRCGMTLLAMLTGDKSPCKGEVDGEAGAETEQ